MSLTFEQLPEAISKIMKHLDRIEAMLEVQKETKQAEELLTVQKAAEFLNVAVPTIYKKMQYKELPVIQQGKRCYFLKSELIKSMKRR